MIVSAACVLSICCILGMLYILKKRQENEIAAGMDPNADDAEGYSLRKDTADEQEGEWNME